MQSAWKNRNLQLYFSGQFVSLIGTWMQQMALSWLVYRLTNSPMMLGVMGFTSQVPSLFFTPLAGILADRLNRHRIIIVTQILSLIQAAILAALVATGKEQLWQLIVLSVFIGIINAFDLTTRQSFLVDMLDDIDQLKSAMGVNSSINTLTRLVGPFFAGLFVAYAGEATCFTANAASYLPVIIALLFVKTNPKTPKLAGGNAIAQLKEAFSYTMKSQPIRDLILLLAFIGVVAMPFAVLMPAFAKDVFHGNASTLGLLTGASSAGSVIGAVLLASRKETRDLSRWIILGTALSGLGLFVFGFSQTMLVSLPAVAVVGFGTMVVMAGANTVIQTLVDEDKRGRVMSFVIMAFMGTMPFGAVLAGAIANKIGVGQTVVVTGVLTFILALIFAKRIVQINNPADSTQVLESILETEAELSEANVKRNSKYKEVNMAGTALLLMDLQNVILERIGNDPAYIDRVKKVLTAARQAKMTIVYVVVKFRPDFPEVSPRNKAFGMIRSGGFPITEGDPATEITSSLAPQSTDIIVTKRRVGAFSGSDLEVVLRSQGIENIVLTGLSTSGVVLSTLRLAADLDYRITVIADCCGDRDEEVHRVLTEKVFPHQADVVMTEEWIKSLTSV